MLRCYYNLIASKNVFKNIQDIFFPVEFVDARFLERKSERIVDMYSHPVIHDVLDGGVRHADVMIYSIKNVDSSPWRRRMFEDLQSELSNGGIVGYHFGCKYHKDIQTATLEKDFVFKSRLYCLDLDFRVLEKDYHLIYIDYVIDTVTKKFMTGYENPFNTMICFSGGGWHIYFNDKRAMKWNENIRRVVNHYVDWITFFDRSRDFSQPLTLVDGMEWTADVTILRDERVAFHPDDYLYVYNRHFKVLLNDNDHRRFLHENGPVFSFLRMMMKFVQSETNKLDVHFTKLLKFESINSIFKWIDDFKIHAKDCRFENPFQYPERLKVTIFYICVQKVMKLNELSVDKGLDSVQHMLRGPFSFKFKRQPSGSKYKFDGYPSLPLGTFNNIRKFKKITLSLEDMQRYEESGNEEHLPEQLQESLRAWERFARYATPCGDLIGNNTDMY